MSNGRYHGSGGRNLSVRGTRAGLPFALLLMLVLNLLPVHFQSQDMHQTGNAEAPRVHFHLPNPTSGLSGDRTYSEFMHQLNGVFVLLLGVLAILEHKLANVGPLRWGWPAIFLLSGIYLAVWSDQDGWPIGDKGFIESLQDPLIFQHKIAAAILLLLGLSELSLRTRTEPFPLTGVFPSLAVSAGVLLFIHSHADHQEPMFYSQHLLMGATAMGIGMTKFISGRFKGSGWVWPSLILLLGLELLFYRG